MSQDNDILVLPNLPEMTVVYEERGSRDTTYYLNNRDVIVKDKYGKEIGRSHVNDDRVGYLRKLIKAESNMEEDWRKTEEASLRLWDELRRKTIKS